MATAEKNQPKRAGQPLLPPEERFWKRYSPHFELPVAGATALFAHAVILGILAIGGIAFLFRASAEASKPAKMDTVFVDPDAAFPGNMGAAPEGEPGSPGDPGGTEVEQGPPGAQGNDTGPQGPGDESLPELPSLPSIGLNVPAATAQAEAPSNLAQQLDNITKAAQERSKVPVVATSKPKTGTGTKSGKKKGTGNPRGTNGGGGPGGSSWGSKGRGMGGGAKSHKATDAEIKAWRWQFDLSGPPREHADKLERVGVIVAVPDPKAGNMDPRTAPLLLITDLKRRPVTLKPAEPGRFADSVKWYNRTPDSIQGLMQELRLPFVPPCIILLMPKDREAKMAEAEMRYAREHGLDPERIQQTTFDFRLQGGVYEPVVINQR
jgi:hypothetical protein